MLCNFCNTPLPVRLTAAGLPRGRFTIARAVLEALSPLVFDDDKAHLESPVTRLHCLRNQWKSPTVHCNRALLFTYDLAAAGYSGEHQEKKSFPTHFISRSFATRFGRTVN